MNVPIFPTPPVADAPPAAPAEQTTQLNQNGGQLSERGIIAVTALGHFLCHLSETIYPAVMVAVMGEFTLEKSEAASLATLGYVLLGAGALPVGIWADAWGLARVFRLYFLFLAAAAVLVALTPSAFLLCVSLTLLGLAASIYHPVGLAMISLGVKARGRAMGINGVAGNFGIALGPALGTALCFSGAWRLAYVLLALLALAAFVLYGRCTGRSAGQLQAQTPSCGAACGSERPANFSWSCHLPLVLLYAAMIFGGLNYRYLMTALPTYISGQETPADARKGTTTTSPAETEAPDGGHRTVDYWPAFQVFLILLVGGVGQYFGGWVSDRFGARVAYPALIACVVPLAVLVGLSGAGSVGLLLPSCLALCMFAQQPVENSVLAERTSRGRRGLSYAAKFTLTFGIGGLGASIVGVIWQRSTLGAVFFLLAASAAVMGTIALVALNLGHRQPDPEAAT